MYKINRKTQAIMYETKQFYKTKIIEGNKVVFSEYNPLDILDFNCRENGASLKGRVETAKDILESRTKLPLAVSPSSAIYFFPTTSMQNVNCVWLSYYQILRLGEIKNQSYICLRNKKTLQIDISYNQLDKQRKRTSQVIAYYYYLYLTSLNLV